MFFLFKRFNEKKNQNLTTTKSLLAHPLENIFHKKEKENDEKTTENENKSLTNHVKQQTKFKIAFLA